MSFGEKEFKTQNYPGAMAYYSRIVKEYADSAYYIDALNRISQIYKEQNSATNEISSLEFLIGELNKTDNPGHNLPVAQFRLAEAQRSYGSALMKSASTNETAEAMQQEGALYLTKAAVGFSGVAKLLSNPGAYQKNAKEKELNEQMLEMATFTKGVALAQLQYPEDKLETYRKLAIQSFEAYLKEFPENKYSANAQLQIGTLYTVMIGAAKDDAAKAEYKKSSQEAFETLSKKYPHSEEAKNSVPMLAAALMDMGLRGEAVAKYREMFTVDGRYTTGQYMKAAEALLESKEYSMALQGFSKVLDDAKDISTKASASVGKAKALIGQKKFAEARTILAGFVKDEKLSKMKLSVEANLLLAEAASEEGKTEADDDLRKDLFNQAVDSLRLVEGYRTNETDKVEIRLETGNMLVRKMDAEKNLGLTEQMVESRGKAIVAYMSLIDRIDPGNADLAPYLEKAYFAFIPMLLEHKAFEQAIEDCQIYLKLFPEGRYKTDVQNWKNQAEIELPTPTP
jgi:tetratricopeptide (TPR) repeat protein